MARTYDEFLADLAKKQAADAAAAQGQPQAVTPVVAPAPALAPTTKGGIPAFLLPPEPKPAAAQKKSAAPSAPKVTTKVETRKAALPTMSQVSAEVKSGAPNAQPGAAPQPPVQRDITLPPDVAQPVDWKMFYDYAGKPEVGTAVRNAATVMGVAAGELKRLAQAQGVDLESINSAKLKGRTYDEVAKAARERGVLGFLPADERLAVFRRSVEDIEKAARGEASDRPIEMVKSGADRGLSGGGALAGGAVGLAGGPIGVGIGATAGSLLGSGGYMAAGTSTELPEVSKPGEYGYLGATLLVEALQKDPEASRIYDLYGRGLSTGNTQKYVDKRVEDLLKRAGLAPGSAEAEAAFPKFRRRAINEVLAYKTIGQWTPAITMQDVQVNEGAAAPGFWASLGPNVELVGLNNKNQAVFRQESPLGVLFRAIDIPQEVLVAKLEGRDAAEGVQAGSNLFEYAMEHTKDEPDYIRYPAMALGFVGSVITPDVLAAGGAVQKGAKLARRAYDIKKNGAEAVRLLETVAEARQAKDFVRATTAERELRDLSPGIADQLDRYDANAAALMEMVDPNTDIFREDMAALIGSQIPAQKEFAAERVFLHPSQRKPALSGNLPKKAVPMATYSGLFDTHELLDRVAEAKKSYIANTPATLDDYAKLYARGTARDVLSDAVDKGALLPPQADEIADIVERHAPVALTDEQRFADLVRQDLKAHPEYGQDKYSIIRQVVYTPGKNRLRGRLDRKLADIKGKTVAQIQAPDLALFDRAAAAVEQNSVARGTGASLLRDEIAKEAKLRVQPLELYDDVALKAPDGKPIRLSPGGTLWLNKVRQAMPGQSFDEAYDVAVAIDEVIVKEARKRKVDSFDLYREILPTIRQATAEEVLRITGRAPGVPPIPAAPAAGGGPAPTGGAPAAAAAVPAALGVTPRMTVPAVMTAPTASTRGAAAVATAKLAAPSRKLSPHGAIAAQFVAKLPARMIEEDIADVARAKEILSDISRGVDDYFEVEGLRSTISSAARDGAASRAVAAGDVRIVVDQAKADSSFVIHVLVGDKTARMNAPRGVDAEAAMRRGVDEAEKLMEARVKAGGPAIKGAPVLPSVPTPALTPPRAVRPARAPQRPPPRVFEPIPDELDLDITAELPPESIDEAVQARMRAEDEGLFSAEEMTQALPPKTPAPSARANDLYERLFGGGVPVEPRGQRMVRQMEEPEPTVEVTASPLERTQEIPRRRIRAELVRGEQAFQRRVAEGEEAFQRNLREAREGLASLEPTESMPERELTVDIAAEPTAKVEAPRAETTAPRIVEEAAEPVFQRPVVEAAPVAEAAPTAAKVEDPTAAAALAKLRALPEEMRTRPGFPTDLTGYAKIEKSLLSRPNDLGAAANERLASLDEQGWRDAIAIAETPARGPGDYWVLRLKEALATYTKGEAPSLREAVPQLERYWPRDDMFWRQAGAEEAARGFLRRGIDEKSVAGRTGLTQTEVKKLAAATKVEASTAAKVPTPEVAPHRGSTFATGSQAQSAAAANRATIETPEFKSWFSESKVVDAEGRPLVVFRGGAPVDVISTTDTSAKTQLGRGAYFGGVGLAEEFASFRLGGEVGAYYLALKNPFDETRTVAMSPEVFGQFKAKMRALGVPEKALAEISEPYPGVLTDLSKDLAKAKGMTGSDAAWRAADDVNTALREMGFDGIIADWNRGEVQYVAFSPEQIKPAAKAQEAVSAAPAQPVSNMPAAVAPVAPAKISQDLEKFLGAVKKLKTPKATEKFLADFQTAKLAAAEKVQVYDSLATKLENLAEAEGGDDVLETLAATARTAELRSRQEAERVLREGGGLRQVSPTGDIKGFTEYGADGRAVILLFDGADASTVLHEVAHVVRRNVLDQDDMEAITKWVASRGVRVGHQYGEFTGSAADVEQAEELFAKAFEEYVRAGVVPNPRVQSAFDRLKSVIAGIYRGVSDPVIGTNLQPEVRQVFDKLFSGVPEDATSGFTASVKDILRREISGRNPTEAGGYLEALAQEAERKGIPHSSLEDIQKQFDTARARFDAYTKIQQRVRDHKETPVQAAERIRKAFGPSASKAASKYTPEERGVMAAVNNPTTPPNPIYVSFPVPVLGKRDWTFDDLADLQTAREEALTIAEKRKQGLLLDLAGGSKTAGAVPEENAVESLRSAIAASDDDTVAKGKAKQVARGVAATFFGGDVVTENGMRNLPPELRNAINTTVAVVEQSIGDTVSLTNDALASGSSDNLYRYLAGEGDVRRLAGRPIVSAGHDYMGSVQQMFRRAIAALSPEEQKALTELCDALNLPAGTQRNRALETLGFDDTGATFKVGDAARQKMQDDAVSAVNKLLYLKGKEKETDFGSALATAMRDAVEAPSIPRPTHEMRLVEAMSYIAGNTSRDGSLFTGDSKAAAKLFITDVGTIYKSEDSARRVAVLIGGYGSAALGKNILVKLNLGISPEAYSAFTSWIKGERWDPRYTEEIQRIVDRYGYNPEFVADQVLASDMYIPRLARERMGEALARAVYRPTASVTGGDAVNVVYRYMKTRMTRGSFFLRQRYFMMNTVDHFIQMSITAGFGTAAASVTRVLAQDLMVLPFWQQIVELLRKVPVAGGAIPPDTLERVRAYLQKGGDRLAGHVGKLFGASKYRIEVNPILEGLDGGFRAGGKVYRYRDIRDIAVQERVFASYDTRQLANAIEREGNLFFSPTLTGSGGTLTTSTGKSRIKNFFADWQSTVSETAEAWGERERLGAMVSFMEAGYDPRTAARLATQALYDYSQTMTKADRSMLVGILFPFWAFQKNANAQIFNTVFSPWGAYRMMCIKRARERGMEALTEILYNDVGDEYEIDVESMPPDLQDSYYSVITRFEESYPNGEPPPEAKRAMRLLLSGRARAVEEGKLVELAANLQDKRNQGSFADLQRFSAYAVSRPSKSQRPTYMRDRTGAAIPFPRTEAMRMYYSMVGDDHSYMELFIPESSIEAGFKHLTQVSAAYMLIGSVPVDFLLGGALTEGGLDEVKLQRVLDPIADPARSPLLAPLLAGSLADAVPPRKVSTKMAATIGAGAEAVKEIHPFVGKLMDDAFGTTFLRVPQIADPFVIDPTKGETMGLPPEEAERIRALQKQYPDASIVKDQRYYIPGGTWATAFDNSPLGELNAMLLRYEANPMERNDMRGAILSWARGSLGIDAELVSPKAVIQREEPEKLKSTREM